MMDNIIKETTNIFVNILKSQSIKEIFDSALSDYQGLLSLNPISYYLLFKKVTNISISDFIFYSKLDKFFRGIEDIPYEKRINYISKNINEKEREFAKKVLANINLIDEEDKAFLIANLQKALFYEKIDLGIFFRLINAVRDTSLEDLYYLLKNKDRNKFEVDISVEFLSKVGLMYPSSFGDNTCGSIEITNIYKISSLGRILITYCLNYGNAPQILEGNITFYSKKNIEVKDTEINVAGIPIIDF